VQRLGVVSFLNARPLIAGLDANNGVALLYDVPARLPAWLDGDRVDAALVPIIDVLRAGERYRVVSDACIGCDGETMTVRVFSQVPPDRIRTLRADVDSHTSVALARVLWREIYDRPLQVEPFDPRHDRSGDAEAVLLIGDKVVDPARGRFAYEVDLGGAWRQHTGLPFVFAVWAIKADAFDLRGTGALSTLLAEARDRGVAEAAAIAERYGPQLGWPVELARRYLTRCLSYRLDARAVAGADQFAALCARAGLVPRDTHIAWPSGLRAPAAVDTIRQ